MPEGSSTKQIIVFIGPEGSGKSTNAKYLAGKINLPYVSTGDILRDLRDNDPDELGDKCREMFAQNTYLDGEILVRILVNRLKQEDTLNGFVLDGGLRTLEETRVFHDMLIQAGRDYPLTVFYLQIPKDVIVERLLSGQNARGRHDDTLDGIERRLAKFYENLDGRLGIVKRTQNWRLIVIDASRSLKHIFRKMTSSLHI